MARKSEKFIFSAEARNNTLISQNSKSAIGRDTEIKM